MQHRAILLVDLLLDQVEAVRAGLIHPRNFEFHVVRTWLCGFSKCIVPAYPVDMHSFFEPPFEERGPEYYAESIAAFNDINTWMQPILAEAESISTKPKKGVRFSDWTTNGLIKKALDQRGTPFPDAYKGKLPEIISDWPSDGEDGW